MPSALPPGDLAIRPDERMAPTTRTAGARTILSAPCAAGKCGSTQQDAFEWERPAGAALGCLRHDAEVHPRLARWPTPGPTPGPNEHIGTIPGEIIHRTFDATYIAHQAG
jgi:hypothetical protein